jgi:hypothetical protein
MSTTDTTNAATTDVSAAHATNATDMAAADTAHATDMASAHSAHATDMASAHATHAATTTDATGVGILDGDGKKQQAARKGSDCSNTNFHDYISWER